MAVLFAVGIPGVLQAWYEKVYDQSAPYGGLRQFTRKLIWVALFLAYIWLEALVGQRPRVAGRQDPGGNATLHGQRQVQQMPE